MDLTLLVCAGAALVAAVLAVAFLPGRAGAAPAGAAPAGAARAGRDAAVEAVPAVRAGELPA
jgi:hypothetical protein